MKAKALLGIVLLALTGQGLAENEKLKPVGGVEIGNVKYYEGASQPNRDVERALVDSLDISSGTEFRYIYNNVSFEEGKKQVIVMLWGTMFSGSGGSTGVLLEEVPHGGYKLVDKFSLFRNPVLRAPETSNGWHDLILPVSGGGMAAQFSRLRYSGDGYPGNPSVAPAVPSGETLTGTAYLATPIGPEAGHYFVAP